MNSKLYKAKVNDLYVKNVSTIWNEITLTPNKERARHFNKNEKEYLLRHIPNAEIQTFSIVPDEGF